MENVILIGRLVRVADYQELRSDQQVANLRLACSRGSVDADGKLYTDYHDVTLWGKNARVAYKYTTTGSLVSINGQLENDDYTDRKNVKRQREYVFGQRIELLETKQQTLAHKAAAQEQRHATSTDDYRHDSSSLNTRDRPLGEMDDWFPY